MKDLECVGRKNQREKKRSKEQRYYKRIRRTDHTKSRSIKKRHIILSKDRDYRRRTWLNPIYLVHFRLPREVKTRSRMSYRKPEPPKYHTVELSEREELSSQILKTFAQDLLSKDGTKIIPKAFDTLFENIKPAIFKEIVSYLPYEVLHREYHKIGDPQIRELAFSSLNLCLIRRDLAAKKFWINRPIIEDYKVPPVQSNATDPIPMFTANGRANQLLKSRQLTKEESVHLSYPVNKKDMPLRIPGETSIVSNISLFQHNFTAFTDSILEGVNLHNAYIGGSCITTCLQNAPNRFNKIYKELEEMEYLLRVGLPLPPEIQEIIIKMALSDTRDYLQQQLQEYYHTTNPSSDIDIFFSGNSRTEVLKSITSVYNQITQKFEAKNRPWKLVRTHNAITICSGAPTRNIQLILLAFQDMREQLAFVDMDCTANLYDGNMVWTTERAIRSFNTRFNFIPPACLARGYRGSVEKKQRLQKYKARGFGNLFYELCKHQPRCDIVPTAETMNAINRLKNQFVNSHSAYSSYVNYYPHYSLDDIMKDLDRTGCYYPFYGENLPWIIGETLSDVILPFDFTESEQSERAEDTPVKPLRWKRTEEALKHISLLPRCYMCKIRGSYVEQTSKVNRIVPICEDCKLLNEEKRLQRPDLTGKVALVTGGRIKIGYECVLSLLRCGAMVIVTTRFPYDALNRLTREGDYGEWNQRVHIYGVDFRNLSSVQMFVTHFKQYYPKLDILINNAAQTIHRPPAYYEEIAHAETIAHNIYLENPKRGRLIYGAVKSITSDPFLLCGPENTHNEMALVQSNTVASINHCSDVSSILFSSQNTIVPVIPTDYLTEDEKRKYFPKGKYDEHQEQIDLREKNTWNSSVDEIHPVELLEVQLVNSVVPSMLLSQFVPLMKREDPEAERAFVINVTSTEGQFTAKKWRGHHSHTNMAKAALNMLTRSTAEDLVQKGILVNSVDTGWVTKMTPGGAQSFYNVDAPLSPADGAARILDPIYSTLLHPSQPLQFGKLFKDFMEATW